MSDAMHRMTVLASAFARIATQFTELATEVGSIPQPAAEATPEAVEAAVAKRINDAQFLRRLSPFVMEEIDMEDLVERVADNIDTDEIVRSVSDDIDTADIARNVAENIDASDVAGEFDLDEVAERIDLTCLAGALIKQDGALVALASEMVMQRYEEKLREQNRAEEVLKQRIEQLTATNLSLAERIRELQAASMDAASDVAAADMIDGR